MNEKKKKKKKEKKKKVPLPHLQKQRSNVSLLLLFFFLKINFLIKEKLNYYLKKNISCEASERYWMGHGVLVHDLW